MANYLMITTHGESKFSTYNIPDCVHHWLTESDSGLEALKIVPDHFNKKGRIDTLILLNHGLTRRESDWTELFYPQKGQANSIGGAFHFAGSVVKRESLPKFSTWAGKIGQIAVFGCAVAASTDPFQGSDKTGATVKYDGNGPVFCQLFADTTRAVVLASSTPLRAPVNFCYDEISDFVAGLNKRYTPGTVRA